MTALYSIAADGRVVHALVPLAERIANTEQAIRHCRQMLDGPYLNPAAQRFYEGLLAGHQRDLENLDRLQSHD